MSEYCITWHSYLYLEADDIDDAVARANQGEGEDTNEVTKLLVPPVMEENNPNNIFSKSKKQEEVDKAIRILIENKPNTLVRNNALKILLGIKNI